MAAQEPPPPPSKRWAKRLETLGQQPQPQSTPTEVAVATATTTTATTTPTKHHHRHDHMMLGFLYGARFRTIPILRQAICRGDFAVALRMTCVLLEVNPISMARSLANLTISIVGFANVDLVNRALEFYKSIVFESENTRASSSKDVALKHYRTVWGLLEEIIASPKSTTCLSVAMSVFDPFMADIPLPPECAALVTIPMMHTLSQIRAKDPRAIAERLALRKHPLIADCPPLIRLVNNLMYTGSDDQSRAMSTMAVLLMDDKYKMIALKAIDQNVTPQSSGDHDAAIAAEIAAIKGYIEIEDLAFGLPDWTHVDVVGRNITHNDLVEVFRTYDLVDPLVKIPDEFRAVAMNWGVAASQLVAAKLLKKRAEFSKERRDAHKKEMEEHRERREKERIERIEKREKERAVARAAEQEARNTTRFIEVIANAVKASVEENLDAAVSRALYATTMTMTVRFAAADAAEDHHHHHHHHDEEVEEVEEEAEEEEQESESTSEDDVTSFVSEHEEGPSGGKDIDSSDDEEPATKKRNTDDVTSSK